MSITGCLHPTLCNKRSCFARRQLTLWLSLAAFAALLSPVPAFARWTSLDTRLTDAGLANVRFINANTGYACGPASTLMRTTNGGDSWALVNTDSLRRLVGFQSLGALSLAANGVIRMGLSSPWKDTGDKVMRLYYVKTTDAGATWCLKGLPLGISLNEVHFLGRDSVCIAGDSGRIAISVDERTWKELRVPTALNVRSVLIDRSRAIIASCDSLLIFSSTDGGVTWAAGSLPSFVREPWAYFTQILKVGTQHIFALANVYTSPGAYTELISSTDEGLTWNEEVNLSVALGGATEMAFRDTTYGIMQTNGMVFEWSVFQGMWSQRGFIDDSSMGAPTNIQFAGNRLWGVTGQSTFKVSRDSGLTWRNYDAGLMQVGCILKMASVRGRRDFAGGGLDQTNFLMTSENGGQSWHLANGNAPYFRGPNAVVDDMVALDSSLVIVSSVTGYQVHSYIESSDQGLTWAPSSRIPGTFSMIAIQDRMHWWAIANYAQLNEWPMSINKDSIFYSSNGGTTWQLCRTCTLQPGETPIGKYSNNDRGYHIAFIDSTAMWVYGCGNMAYYTSDRGSSWRVTKFPWAETDSLRRHFTDDAPPDAYFPSRSSGVLLGYADSTRRKSALWQTSDTGKSWTLIQVLDPFYVGDPGPYLGYATNRICRYGTDWWAKGVNGWIWHSTDVGKTWTRESLPGFPDGYPNGPIVDWYLHDDSTLWAYGWNSVILQHRIGTGSTGVWTPISPPSTFKDLTAEVFPNPMQAHASLRVRSRTARNVTISLFDSFGRLLKVIATDALVDNDSRVFDIDASGLNEGAYFCAISSGNKTLKCAVSIHR